MYTLIQYSKFPHGPNIDFNNPGFYYYPLAG